MQLILILNKWYIVTLRFECRSFSGWRRRTQPDAEVSGRRWCHRFGRCAILLVQACSNLCSILLLLLAFLGGNWYGFGGLGLRVALVKVVEVGDEIVGGGHSASSVSILAVKYVGLRSRALSLLVTLG